MECVSPEPQDAVQRRRHRWWSGTPTPPPTTPAPRSGGARPDDLAVICSLVADRGEPADGVDLRLIAETVGLGGTAVAEVGGVIAATALFPAQESDLLTYYLPL